MAFQGVISNGAPCSRAGGKGKAAAVRSEARWEGCPFVDGQSRIGRPALSWFLGNEAQST